MAYLMRFHGMTRNEAYVACKTKRPIVNPNEGFWKELDAYEIILQTAQKKSTNSKMATIAIDEESMTRWTQRSQALVATCSESYEF